MCASLDAQAAAVQDAMEFLTRTLFRDEERNSGSLFTFKSVSVLQCLEKVTTPKGLEMLTSVTEVSEAQIGSLQCRAQCTAQR